MDRYQLPKQIGTWSEEPFRSGDKREKQLTIPAGQKAVKQKSMTTQATKVGAASKASRAPGRYDVRAREVGRSGPGSEGTDG